MRVIIALGGNALIKRGEKAEAELQMKNVQTAAQVIAEIAKENEVVVTHGNGPQVGLLALQADAYKDVTPYPLDVLGAETQGMIGYMLDQQLENIMPKKRIAVLITQIEVDPKDPAFQTPTKPIGPVYTKEVAEELAAKHGWDIAPDGKHYRRVVPSPQPMCVVEHRTIKLLINADTLVVCSGGGGIPVVMQENGSLKGIEAVIDKDRSAAMLAKDLKSDVLMILTDAPAVALDWGTPNEKALRVATPEDLRKYEFAAGSMGPKVEAACAFADENVGYAVIGSLEDAPKLLSGEAGTVVCRKENIPFIKNRPAILDDLL